MNELALGSKGPEVTIWQNFLTSRSIPVKPDGEFGPKTEAGTKLWQLRAGIAPTGSVDDETAAKAATFGLDRNILSNLITSKPISLPAGSNLEIFPENWDNITKINEAKLAKVSPVVAKRVRIFIDAAKQEGVTLQVVQGLRTFKEQDLLYQQGRLRPGKIVTNARGGQSLHNYGLAVDLAPIVNGTVSWDENRFRPFNMWDDIAGLDWGGNWKKFKDLPHVQDTDSMNLAKVQELYREGGLGNVWAHVT